VVFLEYNINNYAPDSRFSRLMAGLGGESGALPLVMVDSGNSAKSGPGPYVSGYSIMVDNSMVRAPKAEIQALWVRQGNKAKFTVQVKNLSGVTLSSSNEATVHVIVYLQQHVYLTSRLVVFAAHTAITSLANGALGAYNLETDDLTSVDWDKLHYIALVDYIPNSTTGKYDMLQAAFAEPAEVQPEELRFLVDNDDPSVPPQFTKVIAPSSLTWNASESVPWLAITPGSGNPATLPQFTVSKAALVPGWQQTSVSFTSPDSVFTDSVTVKAFLGELSQTLLPVMMK
jgi:hypothetical protein